MLPADEDKGGAAQLTDLEVGRLVREDPREVIGANPKGSLQLCSLWSWYQEASWISRSIYQRDMIKFVLAIAADTGTTFTRYTGPFDSPP